MTTSKPPRVKPLYWRVGEGEWHEEPLTIGSPPRPMTKEEVAFIIDHYWSCLALCEKWARATDDVTFRRSAPPVAQQCKECRRANAARKRVTT